MEARNQDVEKDVRSAAHLADVLRGEAMIDPQTGLYSLAFFYTRLREEIIRSERYRNFLSVILVGIAVPPADSTRQINQIMKSFYEMAQVGTNRRTDVLARFSKHQIAVILPETDPQGAEILASRYDAMAPNLEGYLATGVVSYPHEATNLELFTARLESLADSLQPGVASRVP